MEFIDVLKSRVKTKEKKKIVLPESEDVRVLKAASMVRKEDLADIILIGKKEKIASFALQNGIDLLDCSFMDPEGSSLMDDFVDTYYELRKHKNITREEAALAMKDCPSFGAMLVKKGYADGMVSGAVHSSADTLRVALRIVKTAGVKTASSFFLMVTPRKEYGSDGVFVYSDCGMNQNPTAEQLVDIAYSSAETFRLLVEKEPVIAFLSHSTYGSSNCPDQQKVVDAVTMAKEKYPFLSLDGELQLDAAIIPEIRKRKAPTSPLKGSANVLIFPDLDAGNIAYKITERLALAKAYGPITQGLAKPINDLSRGCSAEDIVGAVVITALQADQLEK